MIEQAEPTEQPEQAEQPTPSDPLDDAVARWYGSLMQTVGPKISTPAYNDLMTARDTLFSILHAARAAK
jgi:hypothetical protein